MKIKGHVYNLASPINQVMLYLVTSTSIILLYLTSISLTVLSVLPVVGVLVFFVYFSDVIMYEIYKVSLIKKDDSDQKKVEDCKNIVNEVIKEARAKNPSFLAGRNIEVYVIRERGRKNDKKGMYNAFVCGIRQGKQAVYITESLYNELVGNNDRTAMKAVIAHELRHISASHALIHTIIYTFTKIIEYISDFMYDELEKNNTKSEKKIEIIQTVVVIVSRILSVFGSSYISRLLENDADNYAVELGYGKDLIRALAKIEAARTRSTKLVTLDYSYKDVVDMEIENPSGIGKFLNFVLHLFSTHPSLNARAQNIKFYSEYIDSNKQELGIGESVLHSIYYTFYSLPISAPDFWRNKACEAKDLESQVSTTLVP